MPNAYVYSFVTIKHFFLIFLMILVLKECVYMLATTSEYVRCFCEFNEPIIVFKRDFE